MSQRAAVQSAAAGGAQAADKTAATTVQGFML